MLNRRGFLGALIGGFTLDPERLLWQPGKKLISIPASSAEFLNPSDWARRYLVRNNSHAKKALRVFTNNAVGTGILPSSEYLESFVLPWVKKTVHKRTTHLNLCDYLPSTSKKAY